MRIDQPKPGGLGRFNPVNMAQNAWDRFSAHPFQGLLTLVGGAVNPALGRGMRTGFDRYNDGQFTGAMHDANAMTQQSGNQAEANAWAQPLGGVLGMLGGAPSYPGQGLPQSAAPWWSTPGVVGGWVAPNGMLDFLGQPDQVMTPDGTGVSLPMGQAPPAASQQGQSGRGAEMAAGMEGNWSGVMGPGANGHALIRGVHPTGSGYKYVYNGRRYGNAG